VNGTKPVSAFQHRRPIPYSLFPIPYSLFPSLFPIPYSLDTPICLGLEFYIQRNLGV